MVTLVHLLLSWQYSDSANRPKNVALLRNVKTEIKSCLVENGEGPSQGRSHQLQGWEKRVVVGLG